jgi:hypothetical protein
MNDLRDCGACADSTPNLTARRAAVDGSRAPIVFDIFHNKPSCNII